MNKEIIWNIVNSLLAGALVFLGGCAAGDLDWQVAAAAGVAALVVAVSKFSEYWKKEEAEYQDKISQKIFSFAPLL